MWGARSREQCKTWSCQGKNPWASTHFVAIHVAVLMCAHHAVQVSDLESAVQQPADGKSSHESHVRQLIQIKCGLKMALKVSLHGC